MKKPVAAESASTLIDRKIEELGAMRKVLATLAQRCHGDDRPDCPIIDELSRQTPQDGKRRRA